MDDLHYLTSNIWEFNFHPKYSDTQNIPSKGLWKFTLNKQLHFQGNTYGEGHPVHLWECIDNKFYIESHYLYGLIEFEIDYQNKALIGTRTLDDGSILPFNGHIANTLNEKLFYGAFKTHLKSKVWRINKLSSLELLYFSFNENTAMLFDAFRLKQFEEVKESVRQEGDEKKEKKYKDYIYILEQQTIVFIDTETYIKVGKIYMDNQLNLKGTFAFPNKKRHYFIQLSLMTEDLIKEVIESLEDDA